MALTDINFQAGDGEVFLFELLPGTLNSPNDIVIKNSDTYPVTEVEGTDGSNIFIMSE